MKKFLLKWLGIDTLIQNALTKERNEIADLISSIPVLSDKKYLVSLPDGHSHLVPGIYPLVQDLSEAIRSKH